VECECDRGSKSSECSSSARAASPPKLQIAADECATGTHDTLHVRTNAGDVLLDCDSQQTERWLRVLKAVAPAAPITVFSASAESRTSLTRRAAGAHDFIAAAVQQSAAPVQIQLDAANCAVCVGSFRATLRPTSFELLVCLGARLGNWVKSEELRERVLRAAAPNGSHVRWHVLEARARLEKLVKKD